jgi:hypothetical protein
MIRSILLAIVTLLPILLASCGSTPESKRTTHHYEVTLRLHPRQQFFEADVTANIIWERSYSSRVPLCLNRQIDVHSVESEHLHNFTFEPDVKCALEYTPDGRILELQFDRPLEPGKVVPIRFLYSGTLTDWPDWLATQMSPDWIELNAYLPWFPYNHALGGFTYDLTVLCETAPGTEPFEAAAAGEFTQAVDTFRFEQNQPTEDIVVCAGPQILSKHLARGSSSVNVHYTTVSDSVADQMGRLVGASLDLYRDWFGTDELNTMTLIQGSRSRAGGYGRRGLIVMAKLSDEDFLGNLPVYIRYLMNKTALMWWWRASADSWEDWLNISMAEYSAMMVIRERFGEEAYQGLIQGKREASEGTRPLWNMPRIGSDTLVQNEIRTVLYDKVPVLLHELVEKIGQDDFREFCRSVYEDEVSNTAAFIAALEKEHGTSIAIWFEDQLRTY